MARYKKILTIIAIFTCIIAVFSISDAQNGTREVQDISQIPSTFLDGHKNIVLCQNESQDDSYLMVVDQDGKWNDLYDLNDVYVALGYDEKENALYVVSSQKILKIAKETEEINQSVDVDNVKELYESGISYSGEDVYVQSVYHSSKDPRVSFKDEKQYYGHVMMENVPFSLIPVAIVVK